MARRKYYTKMKENVSPKNVAFELTNLKRLHKSQLINLLLQQNAKIKQLEQQTINDNNKKPIPKPRKNVKQMVQDYEENIILPPSEFRDDYKPMPKPRTKKPVPLLRTKIEEKAQAMKGYTKSYEINIKNNKDPLEQLKNKGKLLKIISKILLNQRKV